MIFDSHPKKTQKYMHAYVISPCKGKPYQTKEKGRMPFVVHCLLKNDLSLNCNRPAKPRKWNINMTGNDTYK